MSARMGGRRAARRAGRQLVLAGVLVVVTLAIVGAVAAWLFTRPAAPDAATLCPAGGPTAHYVLLVDTTDPLDFTQKQAFNATLRDLVGHRVPPGALLSVFVLGDDFRSTAEPLVELCNPGTGADASALTSNPQHLRQQYEERFLQPMLAQSDKLVATKPSNHSPIFEMLQLVGINAFRRHDVHGEKRLIVMSDMLHNTPQYSMYKGPMDFAALASTDYGRKSMADLAGVDVELLVLLNTPQRQTQRQVKFWEDWFERAGAKVVDVRPLEG
jgi:hypothetical protein